MRKLNGFTLLETMIVIALMAITMTFAVPSLKYLIELNRVNTASSQFIAALNLARSEAIRMGKRTAVSKFNVTQSGLGRNVTTGWHVWVDTNNNQQFDSGTDTEIYNYAAESVQILFTPNLTNIEYAPTGYLVNTNGVPLVIRIRGRTTQSNVITVATTGLITTTSSN